ncbi:MAG: acetoin utilization protein AcuC [Infirmifilum sp.]
MSRLLVVYSDDLRRISFTPFSLREAWTKRIQLFYDDYLPLLEKKAEVVKVPLEPIAEEDLLLAHTPEYVEFVKRKSQEGKGLLDYGDTPAYPHVFEDAVKTVSATLTLTKKLAPKGGVAFNPNGGFHHARRSAAGGFCVFNDLALAALWLKKNGVRKIAIVDIDAHHGDGTQQILYREDILKISIHGYGYGFYPGTGWIDEIGEGQGYCRNVNIPLPLGSGDDVFTVALEEVISPVLKKYNPDFLIIQGGVDAHAGDPIAELRFSEASYLRFSLLIQRFVALGKPVLVAGGGGYLPETVARIWALMLAVLIGLDARDFIAGEDETSSTSLIVNTVKDRINWLKNTIEEKCGF